MRPNGLEMSRPASRRLVSHKWLPPGWPGSVEDPRPSGCFAKRSGGGSIELLGAWANAPEVLSQGEVRFFAEEGLVPQSEVLISLGRKKDKADLPCFACGELAERDLAGNSC